MGLGRLKKIIILSVRAVRSDFDKIAFSRQLGRRTEQNRSDDLKSKTYLSFIIDPDAYQNNKLL